MASFHIHSLRSRGHWGPDSGPRHSRCLSGICGPCARSSPHFSRNLWNDPALVFVLSPRAPTVTLGPAPWEGGRQCWQRHRGCALGAWGQLEAGEGGYQPDFVYLHSSGRTPVPFRAVYELGPCAPPGWIAGPTVFCLPLTSPARSSRRAGPRVSWGGMFPPAAGEDPAGGDTWPHPCGWHIGVLSSASPRRGP